MNIVIVEDNKDLCKILTSFFKEKDDVNIIGEASNGLEGLDLIVKEEPDLVLIDIILPQKDGISLLEDLNELGLIKKKLNCIVITAVSSDEITFKAFKLGAKYIMLKPFDLETLYKRIREFSKKDTEFSSNFDYPKSVPDSLEKRVTSILNEIGIMPNLKGYKYLRAAIILSYENVGLLDGITKFLYPDIAKENKTTCTRVERAIRHALETAWERERGSKYYQMLGFTGVENKKRPTNSEFIASIVDYLKLNN